MANFVSSGDVASCKIPERYVLSSENRPVHTGKVKVPLVDLQDDEDKSINHIIHAAQNFGVFQVINHGISEGLLNDAMEVFQVVFDLPPDEKLKLNKEEDINQVCKISSSYNNLDGAQGCEWWRELLRNKCTPLEECMKFWPQKPENYREIVGAYVVALKELGSRLLQKISQGVGLEKGYFENELSEDNSLSVINYPICPNPSMTIGLPMHIDPTIINFVHAPPFDVPGLQLLRNGQWLDVEMSPNALVVFIGTQLEIVTNGNLKAAVHRVVTNNIKARTSAVFLINPSMECIVEPAQAIVEAKNDLPLYKPFKYKDYYKAHLSHDWNKDGLLNLQNINQIIDSSVSLK